MKFSALLAALGVALSTPALAEQIHKWKDAEGRVHYGQRPPPGQKVDPLSQGTVSSVGSNRASSAGPANSADAESAKIRQQEREFQQRHRARLDREAEAQRVQERARFAEAQAKRAESIAQAERDRLQREQGVRAAHTRQSRWGMR